MANSNKLEWSKVTLDPLSAMLNAPPRDDGEDNDEDNHNAAVALSSPLPASVLAPCAALSANLGALDLNVEASSPSSPPPLPSLPQPLPLYSSSPPPPPYAASFPSSLRPDTNPRKQHMNSVFNNLGTLLSNSLDTFANTISTSGAGSGPNSSMSNGSPGVPNFYSKRNDDSLQSTPRQTPASSFSSSFLQPPPSTAPTPPPASKPKAADADMYSAMLTARASKPKAADEDMHSAMLTGEQRLASLPNLFLQTIPGSPILPGQLIITTYKIQFLPSPSVGRPPQLAHLPNEYFRIPMACIDKTERDLSRRQSLRDPSTALAIYVKDGRVLRVIVPEQPYNPSSPSSSFYQHHQQQQRQQEESVVVVGIERIKGLIDAYAFPEDIHRHLFCFAHHRALVSTHSPLALPPRETQQYDLRNEWIRQFTRLNSSSSSTESSCWLGTPSCPWRLTNINTNHATCASYPSTLIVPAAATDEELMICAAFRSEQRLPVLTWGSPFCSASIWRASQPRVGVSGASCPEDEKVLRLIGAGEGGRLLSSKQGDGGAVAGGAAAASPSPSTSFPRPSQGTLRILDLRSKTAALANRATGHGYESSTNYPTSTLDFCNIGHIHDMRQAQHKLRSLVLAKDSADIEWGAQVENTRWLTHLRLVLNAAYRCAHFVQRGKSSVLLHCSHGWDRTSQVAALAQLFLDPFYRTVRGFQVLIEKDFLGFGHPFQLRTGHGLAAGGGGAEGGGGASRTDDQISPIFLQFLDCVWQVQQQHPRCFEFNSRYLLCLTEHLYDCRFGTFLGNVPKERPSLQRALAPSLWTYLEQPKVRKRVTNPVWGRGGGERGAGYGQLNRLMETPLPVLLRRVKLWSDYWLRWSSKPSHPPEAYVRMRKVEREGGIEEEEGESADLRLSWAWVEEEEDWLFWRENLLLANEDSIQKEENEKEGGKLNRKTGDGKMDEAQVVAFNAQQEVGAEVDLIDIPAEPRGEERMEEVEEEQAEEEQAEEDFNEYM